ncbi:MAG: hypothetical protein HC923_01655 [Myxococcales bacterium]|nr:hypothetical protein [Myxococcales bacterium]
MLGHRGYVSDLLASAHHGSLTGTLEIKDIGGSELVVLLKAGKLMHASGALSPAHRLGEILIRRGAATMSAVEAVTRQLEGMSGTKPLSGAMLVKQGVSPDEVKRAIQAQSAPREGGARAGRRELPLRFGREPEDEGRRRRGGHAPLSH